MNSLRIEINKRLAWSVIMFIELKIRIENSSSGVCIQTHMSSDFILFFYFFIFSSNCINFLRI